MPPKDFQFSLGFWISHEKHWSNEEETIKLIDTIIVSFIVEKISELNIPTTQKALVIWDVFKGQVTEKVLDKLESLDCEFVTVPANMMHFFQPLDLTVNRSAKQFMQKQLVMCCREIVQHKLENGESLEDIEVDLRLTAIKPLHAQWVVGMYNFFTSSKGTRIIGKGWKKAGISGVITVWNNHSSICWSIFDNWTATWHNILYCCVSYYSCIWCTKQNP